MPALGHLFPLLSSQAAVIVQPTGPCARVRIAALPVASVEIAATPTMRRYIPRAQSVEVTLGAVDDVEVPAC